jgi:hypothetical protein
MAPSHDQLGKMEYNSIPVGANLTVKLWNSLSLRERARVRELYMVKPERHGYP